MLRTIPRAILAAALAMQLGCSAPSTPNGPLVVATTGMIGDLARQVAGDAVAVQALMGPGVDPHLYQPKQSDLRLLDQATLVLYNGLHLEGNMVETFERNPRARAVTRALPRERLLIDHGQPDPHVWFDVSLWMLVLDRVEADLCEVYPAHQSEFRANAARYREELRGLHEEVANQLQSIPKERRVLVTAHDAFRYFGRAYDVGVMGLQGVSTADEAGLKETAQLARRIVADKIKAIFTETSVPSEGIERLVEQCAARGHPVAIPKGKLYSDAMDAPGTPAGDYVGMVRANVRLIVEALR